MVQQVSEEQFAKQQICTALKNMVPEFEQNDLLTGDTSIFLDADIPIFKCAAVTDGKYYTFRGKVFKYKKDALAAAKEHGFSANDIETGYSPLSPEVAKAILNDNLSNLQSCVDGYNIIPVVSNGGSYRKKIYPSYKQARENVRTPVNRKPLLEHVLTIHNGIYQYGFEADDLLGSYASAVTAAGKSAVIATIDKDLDTVPGWHWNFDKEKLYYVSLEEAFRFFCVQVLMGDTTDSIPGLFRVGKVGAEKMISTCDTPAEMWQAVANAYQTKKPGDSEFEGDWKEYLYAMASMIYIRQDLEKPYWMKLADMGIDPKLPASFAGGTI